MRILITNDDGINAPGLEVLTEIATAIAGPEGEVWTVAPAFEQSGVGHCISYTHPMMIAELAPRRFAAEGSPADCVLAAIYDVLDGAKPDLVLSGVNRGNNAAENVLYSGTIGGAMEAALQGIPAIALSQFFGPENARLADPFDFAYALLAAQSDDPKGLFHDILDSDRETTVRLDEKLPVHLVYFTAWPTAKGEMTYRRDVYGRDARLYEALMEAGVALGDVQG